MLTEDSNIDGFIIPESCSIENARKDVIYGSEEPFTGGLEEFSEWAMVVAFHRWNVGDRVLWDDFSKALIEAQTSQCLSSLIDKGLIESMWDEEKGEVVFRAKK